jgi:hypothetical protein
MSCGHCYKRRIHRSFDENISINMGPILNVYFYVDVFNFGKFTAL